MSDRADVSFYDPERVDVGVSTKPEILDGKEAKHLLDAKRKFLFKSGELVVVGTDMGVGYKDHNEDRVAVSPSDNAVFIIDGVGGVNEGEMAASTLGRNLLINNEGIEKSADQASRDMNAESNGTEGGAVFIGAKLKKREDGSKYLEVSQAGDSRLTIFDLTGKVKYISKGDSRVSLLVEIGKMSEDEALYSNQRNIVYNVVGPKHEYKVGVYQVDVSAGDVVVLESDGTAGNFTPEELSEKIADWTAESVYDWIAENSQKRMVDAEKIEAATPDRKTSGIYADGYKSQPRRDNRSLAVFKIS